MEAHEVMARHHLRNTTGILAFSALPNAPVLPDRPRRRPLARLARAARTLTARRRAPEGRPAATAGVGRAATMGGWAE